MRRCVFLAALLALVLSLSKGENKITATTPTTTTAGTTGENATTPTTTATDTLGGQIGVTHPGSSAVPTTKSTSETDSDPSSPTTTETPGSSSDTSPTPNLTTTTETTGSSSDTSPTPNLMTTTDTPDSRDHFSDTSNTTITTDAEEENATTPTTTDTNATESTSETDSATTLTPTTDTTEENDTVNASTFMTTAANTTGENNITATTPTTTTAGTTGENNITATTPTTTTAGTTEDFCKPNPCGTNLATCVLLNTTFTCLCQYGFYYRDNDCHRGKIFPGVITLQGTYDDSVLIVNSMQYEEVLNITTQFFKYAFENLTGYEQTVIVEIQLLTGSRASTEISVTVINLFMRNTTANNETVSSAAMNATENSPFVLEYIGTSYCAVYNCDPTTTVCEDYEFPQCTCKNEFSKTEWDILSCSNCSKDCFQRENMYCAKEDGGPTCTCISNFKKKGGKCVPCSVGYSGEQCEDNTELILIIVGTVLGAVVLCLAIAVAVVSIRAKHKQDPEKKTLLRSGYSNPNTSEDRQPTMFPRVRTTTGHANPGYQPNNPYEMRDFDDLYEASREPEGFRIHSRN